MRRGAGSLFMSIVKPLQNQVRKLKCADKAKAIQRFFKTDDGEYGHGDKFLGVYNAQLRTILKGQKESVPLTDLEQLLASEYNEERALALMFLVDYYKRAKKDAARQKEIFDFYCSHTHLINNWNLVDNSCHLIVGDYLRERPRDLLKEWAHSDSVWERRMAVVSTSAFIQVGDYSTTFELAKSLLDDPESLIHKAIGCMLRDVGKRDIDSLSQFLCKFSYRMPRVMLRAAVEKLSVNDRSKFLEATGPLGI